MITWQESYSTGIAELDKQHRALFNCANELGGAIEDNALSKEIIEATLSYLKQYIEVHFGREENCMHRYSCPVAAKNKDAHTKFIVHFNMLAEKIRQDDNNDARVKELHHFLETWLVEHICKIDTRLKTCVTPGH